MKLEPLTVKYDGGIALRGLALGQGAEQMSSRQLLDLGRDRPLWMALRWQTDPGLDVDYAISLRLYNVEGRKSISRGRCSEEPAGAFLRVTGGRKKRSISLTVLAVPADLPAGNYELRLVVYDWRRWSRLSNWACGRRRRRWRACAWRKPNDGGMKRYGYATHT